MKHDDFHYRPNLCGYTYSPALQDTVRALAIEHQIWDAWEYDPQTKQGHSIHLVVIERHIMAEETAVEATKAEPTAVVEVTPAPVTTTPTIEDMVTGIDYPDSEFYRTEEARSQERIDGAEPGSYTSSSPYEHKGNLTWKRLKIVEERRDKAQQERDTLQLQVQQLQRQVETLKEDNQRLHDANVDMLDKLSKADAPETTILPPYTGGYLRIGRLEFNKISGVLWLEEDKDEKPRTFTEAIVSPAEQTPSGALAALSTRQQWAVRQNAEVIKTIFETMNQRSLARIAEQEKPQ